MERLSLSSNQVNRLTQLLLLAATVLVYSVIAMAVANSLFVSHVGAGNLPLAFIFIGLCSMPAYAIFAQIIDRYSRPQLFRYVLLISIAVILGLRFLLTIDSPIVYYILLIAVFFQWDFHNNILYPSLLTDYFTTLEYKRYAPFIGIAQALGTMVGGGLTVLLSHYLRTRDLLLSMPIIFVIAFAQLLYLEKSQRRLDKIQTKKSIGIIESLQTFPDLVKRYPLVLFLASSSFLLVIIYISSEFLWFNIYGQHFSEEALTGFLGLMRIVISLVQVFVLYVITRPLLQWLGVARMNTVYPLTTLASLSGLLFKVSLPTGIGLHLNGDALYKAINLPVHQLNYNGIPQEFIGRVRALSDGFIYSIGLTLAGIVLWFCHLYLDLVQITWLAAGLTVLLLLVRIPMGKFYAQSLEEMIRSDTINLDDFNDYQTQLPSQSSTAIRKLLSNDDLYVQIKGLELAANLSNPSQFLPEINSLLLTEDPKLSHEVVKLFATNCDAEAIKEFENLLEQDNPSSLRAIAVEILIANHYNFSDRQIEVLLTDSDRTMRLLGAVAAIEKHSVNKTEQETAWTQIWQSPLEYSQARAIVRIVTYSGNQELAPLVIHLLPQANAEIKQQGLKALSVLASVDNFALAEIAVKEMNHPEPLVRSMAFKLLAITRCPAMLSQVTTGLKDPSLKVRQQVARTLAAYGKLGLSLARESLSSPQREVVNTAISAIAKVRTRSANDILFKYLAPEFEQLIKTRKWQQQIPPNDPSWKPLAIAIEDYHKSLIQKVLYILSCLGYARTVNSVTRILATTDQRDLANAVEVLVSLNHRRFVLPLVPLLEQIVEQEKPASNIKLTSQWLRNKGYKILLEALESKHRWIRTGALIALARIPSTLLEDPDPVVQVIAGEIFPPSCQLYSTTNSLMNRLLLLKNVALFKNLSLDELLLIDQALEQQQVLTKETIYTEGSWGSHLYIIAEGIIQIVKQIDGEEQEIKQLTTEQYFGEVALFDNAPRWDGAIALQDSILLKLEKKRFISLITQRPQIILEICRFLSKRLRETDKYTSSPKKIPSTLVD